MAELMQASLCSFGKTKKLEIPGKDIPTIALSLSRSIHPMMQRRNNYARADVVILYRLYMWMGNMYAHNNSVQRVDSSERTVVMCIYKVSYRIGFFIDNDYKSAANLQLFNEIYLRRWEKN